MSNPPDTSPTAQFLNLLRESLEQQAFIQLELKSYQGPEPALRRLQVTPLTVRNQPCLSFLYDYHTQHITKNLDPATGFATIVTLLGNDFKSAHLRSNSQNVRLQCNRKGHNALKCTPTAPDAPMPSNLHDRQKTRIITPDLPFLTDLGITGADHRVLPSMSHKWKQINKFLEIFLHAWNVSRLAGASTADVVDFACGKGYLTFALHALLRQQLGVDAHVTGIELREALTQFCNTVATRHGATGLTFRQGDLHSEMPPRMDVLIALHACDTATDLAIHLGIRADATIIMCAPCCHKQLRPQLRSPEVLAPMLRFGTHLGQEAEMLTDSLRALLLEAHGYTTQIQEFISLEHTSKNKMLLAIKQERPKNRAACLEAFHNLKAYYGIHEMALESLLSPPSPPCLLPASVTPCKIPSPSPSPPWPPHSPTPTLPHSPTPTLPHSPTPPLPHIHT